MYHKSLHKKEEKGQGLVEYALILVLVAIVVIAALMILGPIVGNVFSKVNSSISGVGSVAPAAAAPAAPAAPTEDPYVAWCNSLGFPYHINSGGVCVKTN
jgi:pilus assembly protein Flp/PilA